MVKRCSKCGEEKDLTEFAPRKGSRDGLRGQCRECHQPRRPGMECEECGVRKTFTEFYPTPDGGYLPKCRPCHGAPTDPRLCEKCDEWVPLTGFHRRKEKGDGFGRVCKSCLGPADPDAPRECLGCGEWKPLDEFFRKETGDGYVRRCRACYAVNNTKVVRSWREENREKYLEQNRDSVDRWREKYPERREEMSRRDYERHRDRYYVHNRARRARLKEAEVFEISEKDLRRIMSQPCAHCGGGSEHLDHIIPLARGGSHSVGNLQGLCAACNGKKRDRLEVEVRHGRRRPNA